MGKHLFLVTNDDELQPQGSYASFKMKTIGEV